jgi:hypothetical protein
LLREDNECRELLIPPGAAVRVEFGIDEERLQGRWIEARFRLIVDAGNGSPETILDQTLDSESESLWQRNTVRLRQFAYKRVTMCVATEAKSEMEDPLGMAEWVNPVIFSRVQRPFQERPERLTKQERELREQQLNALGYVQ